MGDWRDINNKYIYPAKNAMEDGEIEKANGILERAITEYPNDGYVALTFGNLLLKQGRYTEALEMFEKAERNFPLDNFKEKAREGIRKARLGIERSKKSLGNETKSESPKKEIKIGLLSCTKSKTDCICAARGLYSASKDFRRHLEIVENPENNYDKVFIISAKHGLVELDQILKPYDIHIKEYAEEEALIWAKFIIARLRLDLEKEGKKLEEAEIYIHASDTYWMYLKKACEEKGITCRHISWK